MSELYGSPHEPITTLMGRIRTIRENVICQEKTWKLPKDNTYSPWEFVDSSLQGRIFSCQIRLSVLNEWLYICLMYCAVTRGDITLLQLITKCVSIFLKAQQGFYQFYCMNGLFWRKCEITQCFCAIEDVFVCVKATQCPNWEVTTAHTPEHWWDYQRQISLSLWQVYLSRLHKVK